MDTTLCLIDTSIWIEVLPPGRARQDLRERVRSLVAARQGLTTGMVRCELLRGARNEAEYRDLADALDALPVLPMEEETWRRAARLGYELRRRGLTIPSTDLLIAAAAIQADAVLIHRDHHFDTIASHHPLRVESYIGG